MKAIAIAMVCMQCGCFVGVPDLEKGPGPGARGVLVSLPAGHAYRVDPTEVTNAEYAAWLGKLGAGAPAGQPADCKAKTSWKPGGGWPASADDAQHPVTYVDWCDATAYCTSNGERLCGDQSGEALDPDKGADASASEWFNACSSGGAHQFPYGDQFDESKCNSSGMSSPVLEPVTCEGGFKGLFGMVGNAREWENACTAADCVVRGGGYKSNPPSMGGDLACDVVWTQARLDDSSELTGIRCCSDASAQ